MSGIACFERPCGSLQDESQASSEGRSEERTLPIATNRDIYRPGLSGERELRGTHRQEANELTECLAPKNRHNNQPRGAAHNDCTKAEKCSPSPPASDRNRALAIANTPTASHSTRVRVSARNVFERVKHWQPTRLESRNLLIGSDRRAADPQYGIAAIDEAQ